MRSVIGLLLFVLSVLMSTARADQVRPARDYMQEVASGNYVLVMLARQDRSLLDPDGPDDAGLIERDAVLRQRYKQSGLYPAGDTTPLWVIDWYAFAVFPASDGVHLVRLGPWASSLDQLALAFYASGVEIKRYPIRELVADTSRLRRTVSHFFWLAEQRFDDAAGEFHLKAVDGRQFRFSIRTGEMLSVIDQAR